MLYLRTGQPGASKTLNTLKEIVEDKSYDGVAVYYHNIKVLLLDLDVCFSFDGFFYGHYYHSLTDNEKHRFEPIINRKHSRELRVTLDDVPFLKARFEAYKLSDAPLELFLTWARKLYTKSRLQPFEDYLKIRDQDEPVTKEVIRSFNLDWRHFDDPTKWMDLPNGSVIVVDECQDYFPPMSPSAKRPLHYSQFAKHRHSGVDIHLVTQTESLLDMSVRRMAHRHIHYFNKFGGSVVHRIEAPKCFNTDSRSELNAQPSGAKKRDPNYYGVYWSADKHTHKLRVPKVYIFAAVVLFSAVVFVAYGTYDFLSGSDNNAYLAGVSSGGDTSITDDSLVVTQSNRAVVASSPPDAPAFYFEEQATDFDHPLASRCSKLLYAGFEKLRRSGGYSVKHYLSCYTGETVAVNRSTGASSVVNFESGGEPPSRDEVVSMPVSRLVGVDVLTDLGYNVEFKGRYLYLAYGASVIMYERHL